MKLFEQLGAAKMARQCNISIRGIYQRRRNLENKNIRWLRSPQGEASQNLPELDVHPQRHEFELKNGIVLVGSDPHYWPGMVSCAHRGYVQFCKELKPKAVIMNGDVLDGATISRWPQIGWESRPSLISELEASQERLDEIYAVTKGAKHIWPLGNHDGRYEMRLAQVAPEFARIHGTHLKDHFPEWTPCWSVWINDKVIIKHRFKGGVHATHNNALWAGKTMVTGHDHMLKVTHLADYNGVRWGVSTGLMAEPYGQQFVNYTEDAPKNWVSGFVVLTFRNGELLWPEIARAVDSKHIDFRGEIIAV